MEPETFRACLDAITSNNLTYDSLENREVTVALILQMYHYPDMCKHA